MESSSFYFNLNPYLHSSSSEEEKIDENLLTSVSDDSEKKDQLLTEVIQNRTLEFREDCAMLNLCTLAKAENLIQQLIEGKVVHFLNPLNILFIEVMKVMQLLSRDRTILSFRGGVYSAEKEGSKIQEEVIHGDQIINHLTIELHLIFRVFREYADFHLGKTSSKVDREKILQAQEGYKKIANLYRRLEKIIKKTDSPNIKVFHKLKQYCDVLYHASQNEDFLQRCTKSLSNGLSVMLSIVIYPQTLSHMEFYIESLDICLFSLLYFQKNDPTIPMPQMIEQIKKIPKACFDTLSLDAFIQSIGKFHFETSKLITEYLVIVKKIIIDSKFHSSNLKLKACFIRLALDDISFVKMLQEMFPLVMDISNPWKSFRDNHNVILKRFEVQIQSLHIEFEKAVISLKKALDKSKTVKGKTRNDIYNLIHSVEKQTAVQSFLDQINSFIVESCRIPQNINQEMLSFFLVMGNCNQKAINFHQSLLMHDSKLPCASFTSIDLLVHQLFQLAEITKHRAEENDVINHTIVTTAIQMVKDSIKIICAKGETNILKIFNLNEKSYTIAFHIQFNEALSYLNNAFNQEMSQEEALRIQHLKGSIQLLIEYLKDSKNNVPIFQKHLASTLFNSLGGSSEISDRDLPLIKQHLHLIATSVSHQEFEQHLVQLEHATKKRLDLAAPAEKFFWKLNYKHVMLGKIHIKEMLKASHHCNQKIQGCDDTNTALLILHEFYKKTKFLEKNYAGWMFQLTLLGKLAEQQGYEDIFESIYFMSSWNLWTGFLHTAIHEIVDFNPVSKKAPFPIGNLKINSIQNLVDSSSENDATDLDETAVEEEPLPMLQETYTPSPYEEDFGLLNTLKAEPLPLIMDEPIQSFMARRTAQSNLIQNCSIYRTLIEEAKKWGCIEAPKSLQIRGQLSHLLLLEATQKIALSNLRIGTQEAPNIHIISSNYQGRPLIYTHNGELLVKLLFSANKQWFEHPDIESSIRCQEFHLKKIYWFQEDPQAVPGIHLITAYCNTVWKDLVQPKKEHKQNHLHDQAVNFQDCRSKIHKFKRNQNVALTPLPLVQEVEALKDKITLLISSLQIDPQCRELIKSHREAIRRIFDFHQTLNSHENKGQMALFFATRSADIQVCLLSLILILALSTIKFPPDQPHPLFLNEKGLNEGRPLFHIHRVDKLWKVLKNHLAFDSDVLDMLDTYLPLFVGDPRYPYPNKTVMTNELVNMHERVCLLQKIESAWFDKEDQKAFTRHLGKGGRLLPIQAQREILNLAIEKGIEDQKQKTLFAFHLAESLLRSLDSVGIPAEIS